MIFERKHIKWKRLQKEAQSKGNGFQILSGDNFSKAKGSYQPQKEIIREISLMKLSIKELLDSFFKSLTQMCIL